MHICSLFISLIIHGTLYYFKIKMKQLFLLIAYTKFWAYDEVINMFNLIFS